MHAVFCHYANKSISPSLFLSKDSRTHQVIQQVMSLVFIAQLCRISVNRGKKTPFFLPSLLWHVKPTLSGINLIPGSDCLLYWHSQQTKKCFNSKKKKKGSGWCSDCLHWNNFHQAVMGLHVGLLVSRDNSLVLTTSWLLHNPFIPPDLPANHRH